MNQTKAEFLAEKAAEFDRKVKGDILGAKIERQLSKLRAKGYKVIVLGSKVKVT